MNPASASSGGKKDSDDDDTNRDSQIKQEPTLASVSSTQRHRQGVCITGQVKLIVLEKIIETLLEPCFEKTRIRGQSCSANWKWSPLITYQQAHDYFNRVVTNTSYSPPGDPPVPPYYLKRMYRPVFSEAQQKKRVQNHARQFMTVAKCYETLLEQQQALSSEEDSTKASSGGKQTLPAAVDYGFSVRLARFEKMCPSTTLFA